MHRIIESYLKTFCEENRVICSLPIEKQFEMFANYCVIKSFYPAELDSALITSNEDDAGIDGICFIIDGELVTTIDEAEEIFKRPKRNITVTVYFMQSKTGESYDRGEILKFSEGVLDFITNEPKLPQGDFIVQQKKIFDLLIENVSKIQNGRADVCLNYITNSNNELAPEIVAAKESIVENLNNSGYFNDINFEYIGLEGLISLWDRCQHSNTAVIPTKQISPYPTMTGISEAYLAIVPLKDFVETVLMDSEGKLRIHIFEENVRAFLGETNPVNKQIIETLRDEEEQNRFAVLNNGVTIISSDVKVQNDKIAVDNYQIVNGCQTSNVLFENYQLIKSDAMVTVKFIEVTDSDVISSIVRATNSQSKVEETQFLSYDLLIRRIEKYFNATEDIQGKEVKLYFERRVGQYKDMDVAKGRIFSVAETCRAVGAMFLKKPDMAYRYPTKMISTMRETLTNDKNKEIVYYTAAIALYRFKLYLSNGRIDSKYAMYKWHILMVLTYVGKDNKQGLPSIQNKKIEAFCKKIISTCSKSDEKCLALFKKATDVLDTIGLKTTRDEIRSQAYAQAVIQYCEENFR